MPSSPLLTIVIPVYNEENRIGESLNKISHFISTQPFDIELVIVDDGSKDKTLELVNKYLPKGGHSILRNEINSGKGSAVKKGMMSARGKYVLFTDADLSTPLSEIQRFISIIENHGYDIVIGSRALDRSQIEVHQSLLREIMGKVFNRVARMFSFNNINDSQCGFKLFSHESCSELFKLQRINGFAFDAEILYLAQRKGYKIKEEPVIWSNSDQTRVRIWVDPLLMLKDIIQIRWMHRDLR